MIESEDAAREFCAARCDSAAMDRLDAFVTMLGRENQKQNLVSAQSLSAVWQRHIADSLQLLDYVPRETSGSWIDLGSGAGMPGLVISIAIPSQEMHLVESRKRRIDWLETVREHFGLSNCHVRGGRLEALPTLSAAVLSARAFAPLAKLIDLSARFSTRDTVWLLPKGRSARKELAEQPEALKRMFHVEPSHTDQDAEIVIGKGRPALR